MRRRLIPILAVVAFHFGCGDPAAPVDGVVGFYAMNTLDGHTLPAPFTCVGTMEYSTLELRPDRGASLHRAVTYPTTGDRAEYVGNGTFRRVGDAIVLSVEGRWSGEQQHDATIVFTIEGQALRETLASPCDGDPVAVYLPALVALE